MASSKQRNARRNQRAKAVTTAPLPAKKPTEIKRGGKDYTQGDNMAKPFEEARKAPRVK